MYMIVFHLLYCKNQVCGWMAAAYSTEVGDRSGHGENMPLLFFLVSNYI